jgi:anti-sigma factor RsiW
MSQACARWRGDIGAYILGALSPESGARVKRHLETCTACRTDYEDLVPVRDWLSLLAAAAGMPGGHVPGRLPLEPVRPSSHRARRRWLASVTGRDQPTRLLRNVVITMRLPILARPSGRRARWGSSTSTGAPGSTTGPGPCRRRSMTDRKRPMPADETSLTWRLALERVTGIEPALSAWESVPYGLAMQPDLREGLPLSDRERPFLTGLMAR